MENELTNRPPDLPPERAGFSSYNTAVVAFRYAKKRRSEVPISRWVETAELCAKEGASNLSLGAGSGITLMTVLEHLGLTRKAGL